MRNESRKARWTDQGQPVVRGEERQRWSNFEWNRENGLASLGNGPRIHRRQRAESWLENLALYPCSAVGHPVMRNMKSGSHGLWMGTPRYMYVRVCAYIYVYIYISLSFSGLVSHSGLYPSLYRRSTCVSWEDLGGPLSVRAAGHCPLRNGQTGPRGADLYPFQSYPPSFHGKTPFLVFSSK